MTLLLEHANIAVRDIDGTIRFLQTAFPSFGIRHDETGADGCRWVHIGTDNTYIALNQATEDPAEDWTPYDGKPGIKRRGDHGNRHHRHSMPAVHTPESLNLG